MISITETPFLVSCAAAVEQYGSKLRPSRAAGLMFLTQLPRGPLCAGSACACGEQVAQASGKPDARLCVVRVLSSPRCCHGENRKLNGVRQ